MLSRIRRRWARCASLFGYPAGRLVQILAEFRDGFLQRCFFAGTCRTIRQRVLQLLNLVGESLLSVANFGYVIERRSIGLVLYNLALELLSGRYEVFLVERLLDVLGFLRDFIQALLCALTCDSAASLVKRELPEIFLGHAIRAAYARRD